jgi:hypothetical protein
MGAPWGRIGNGAGGDLSNNSELTAHRFAGKILFDDY